jgi:hypothetical protein
LHRSPSAPRRPPLPALLALLAGCLAAAPALAAVSVTIHKPLDGDILASPIDVTAEASTSAPGARVSSWHVYVDGVSAYGTAGNAATMATRLAMDNGDHEIVVFAWDSIGDSGSAAITMTVGTCSGFTVSLDAPAGGTEPAPVHFAASAASCHRITSFALFADDQRVFTQRGPRSIDTYVDLPAGNHTVYARAWDSTGDSATSSSVPIEVEPKVTPKPPRPTAPPKRPPPDR